MIKFIFLFLIIFILLAFIPLATIKNLDGDIIKNIPIGLVYLSIIFHKFYFFYLKIIVFHSLLSSFLTFVIWRLETKVSRESFIFKSYIKIKKAIFNKFFLGFLGLVVLLYVIFSI